MGCSLLRFAVPDMEAAEVLGKLSEAVTMPLVADIHFDYKIALRCLDFPIAKIRINPGNIGNSDHSRAVISRAQEKQRPIRIGVNGGSLPQDLAQKAEGGQLSLALAMVEAAERELAIFDEHSFKEVLLSMKASNIRDTIEANRLMAQRRDILLHVGVTEAGPHVAGTVRNTAALLALLKDGIGDTIRVSLSDTMEREVMAGREILDALEELYPDLPREGRPRGVQLISCPRCGRSSFDTIAFTARWENRLYAMAKDITVAIMGCVVNGPGEGRHADLGITGAGEKVLIFRHGQVVKTIEEGDADRVFAEELDKF